VPQSMRKRVVVLLAAAAVFVSMFAQWRINSQLLSAADKEDLTKPLPGLVPDSAEWMAFYAGLDEFSEVEKPEDGLGPVFNGKSCAECHAVPSVGGSEPNVGVARETRIGRIFNGGFDPLDGVMSVNRGGGLLQQRAIDLPGCHLQGEVVPPEATIVSLRNTTPLFGAGLIEAIPAATILGIASRNFGRPNYVVNPDRPPGAPMELGRFGWKAQVATLHQFAGDAYLNEMGITNPSFPKENLPQGQPIPPGCGTGTGLEDTGSGVDAFTNFMRFLAPAPRLPITPQVQRGEVVFTQVLGCASCHVPTMMTGPNSVAALSSKPVNLFSDLLLHDVGTGDGIEQGSAKGNEFRTAPLWGLSRRDRFMHDGRSNKIEDAILRHGGEAQNAANGYEGLSKGERDDLLAFLNSL
jgi:CxxC motif-containing protein (DUF1111 family)